MAARLRSGDIEWNPAWEMEANDVPAARYTCPEYLEAEYARLWPRVWQAACRVEQLPEPGSFVEYEIGDQSILIVRADHDTFKAFFNSCMHRGTTLAQGSGCFERGIMTCPFHGWAYRLNGECALVTYADELTEAQRDPERLRLVECRVEIWAGFVFVNMDPEAPPLQEAIGSGTRWADIAAIDRMTVIWHRRTTFPANWKNALGAFQEAYHADTAHPQFRTEIRYGDPGSFGYFADEKGCAHAGLLPDAEIGKESEDQAAAFYRFVAYSYGRGDTGQYSEKDVEIARMVSERAIPEDSSVYAEYLKELYAHAATHRIPLPTPTPEESAHIGSTFLFPNLVVTPVIGGAVVMRFRPAGEGVEYCVMDWWSLRILAEDEAGPDEYAIEEVDSQDIDAVGEILWQDFATVPRSQKGMRARGFERLSLNPVQEIAILNMHREMDRYLKD